MNALFAAAKEVCDFMQARRWKFCQLKHYGLTDNDLDFIINYVIKDSMGCNGGEAEED
jgi:hypothetical protein